MPDKRSETSPRNLGEHLKTLPEGYASKPVRVRAPTWVHERLRGMTAAEIGETLERALTKS